MDSTLQQSLLDDRFYNNHSFKVNVFRYVLFEFFFSLELCSRPVLIMGGNLLCIFLKVLYQIKVQSILIEISC
jgi:hypothetical protein